MEYGATVHNRFAYPPPSSSITIQLHNYLHISTLLH